MSLIGNNYVNISNLYIKSLRCHHQFESMKNVTALNLGENCKICEFQDIQF